MSKEGKYVTGSLHRISGQIAVAAKKGAGDDAASEDAGRHSATTELVSIPPPPVRSPEMEQALQRRHEDYSRLKRDVVARLSAALSSMPEEASQCRRRMDDLAMAEGKLREILKSVESLEEPRPADHNYASRLAEAFKTVENSRLEMIRTVAKTEKGSLGHRSEHGKGGSDSLYHEFNSLSFRQLFKFGLYAGLPIALAIALSGLLVAFAIFLALRVGV